MSIENIILRKKGLSTVTNCLDDNITVNPLAHCKCGLADFLDETKSSKNKYWIGKIREYAKKSKEATNITDKEYYKKRKNDLKTSNLSPYFPSHYTEITQNDYIIHLTGLVHFDIDIQENLDVDFIKLRNKLLSLSYLVYCFWSPSGGLKFGIITDLHNRENEGQESVKGRYSQGYEITKEVVIEHIEDESVSFDNGARSVFFPCYSSYDEDLFVNDNASILEIDNKTIYKKIEVKSIVSKNASYEDVSEILTHIDKNKGYNDRLPINSAVLSLLGKSGVSLLEQHWNTSSRKKLASDLDQQLKNIEKGYYTSGGMGVLVNAAKANGWKPPKGLFARQETDRRLRQLAQTRKETHKEDATLSKGKRIIDKIESPFEPLLTLDEAKQQLAEEIQNFMAVDNVFKVLSISAGTGKTETTCEALKKCDLNTNILIQVPTHKLGDQIYDSLKKKKDNFEDMKTRKAVIVHLKGKTELCENEQVKKAFNDAKMTIPNAVCYGCPLMATCGYIQQFSEPANIRIMTHNEWRGMSSAFFGGTFRETKRKVLSVIMKDNNDIKTVLVSEFDAKQMNIISTEKEIIVKDKTTSEIIWIKEKDFDDEKYWRPVEWMPEKIIIDENPIEIKEFFIRQGDGYLSIDNIIQHIRNKNDEATEEWQALSERSKLIMAILENKEKVLLDYERIQESFNNRPKFTVITDYMQFINDYKIWESTALKYNKIIKRMRDFCRANDELNYLDSIWFSEDRIRMSEYIANENKKWKEIPTLILDATAKEPVISKVLPEFEYKKLRVAKRKDIIIKQLISKNISRHYLSDGKHRSIIENGIAKLINGHPSKKVGIITYKKLKGYTENYSELLTDKMKSRFPDIEFVYGHFGNTRGMNNFSDVDLLLIVGRHFSFEETLNTAFALYGEVDFKDTLKLPMPVCSRLSDGNGFVYMNDCFTNEKLQTAYEITTKPEQIQNIARGRWYYGKAKTICVLSNESLHDEMEIDKLLLWDDWFSTEKISRNRAIIDAIRDGTGAIEFMPRFLNEAGLTYRSDEKNMMIQEFYSAGFKLYEMRVKDRQWKNKDKAIMGVSREKVEEYCFKQHYRIVE